jgi:hypothetical protein
MGVGDQKLMHSHLKQTPDPGTKGVLTGLAQEMQDFNKHQFSSSRGFNTSKKKGRAHVPGFNDRVLINHHFCAPGVWELIDISQMTFRQSFLIQYSFIF